MEKKLFQILVCLVVFSGIILSQVGYRDVVYLKNGGKVIGIIIEQVPNVSIKIETLNGSVMVFKMDEIERIVKEKNDTITEPPPAQKSVNVPPPPPPIEQPIKSTTETKFQFEGTSATFAGGVHNVEPISTDTKIDGNTLDEREYDSHSGFVFVALVEFQGSENFSFLFGGTVDSYANGAFTSYYLGGQFYFSKDSFSPFAYLKGGYGFGDLENPFDSNEDIRFTGPYFSGGAGAKLYLGHSWGLYGEAGYKYQGTSSEWEYKDYSNRTHKIETTQNIAGFQFLGGIFFYP